MSDGRRELFERLASQVATFGVSDHPEGVINVPDLVAGWLAAGPRVFAGEARTALDSLCRQIDVRKRVSVSYAPGWERVAPEVAAAPTVLGGLVAVLLANAERVGAPSADGPLNDAWGCKCLNSALKALDLGDRVPNAPELRMWALEVVDRLRWPEIEPA